MTILTGVSSPNIVGSQTKKDEIEMSNKTSQNLGIKAIY